MMGIGEDAAGQLADAALLGAAFEQGGAGDQSHDPACANCGAALQGRYCHVCGQIGHVHRSVLHLVEEFFHGLFHFDGKLWRTIPLLLARPGALTRRYVEGHRVRFVSPIGLFLFCIFLMFFAVATIDADQVVHPEKAVSVTDPAKLKQDLAEAREQIGKSKGDPAAIGKVEAALDMAEKAADAAPPDAKPADAKPADAKPADAGASDDADPGQLFQNPLGLDWRKTLKKMANKSDLFTFGGPEVEKRIRTSLADPDLLVFKLRSAASEYSFLLVPASVPFLWLMFFWKRRVYLYDHVIFSLHSLSFMALLVTAMVVALEFNIGRQLWFWALLIPPLHMLFHLKGTYRLGVFGALWRTFLLSTIAIIVLLCYVFTILLLGLLH